MASSAGPRRKQKQQEQHEVHDSRSPNNTSHLVVCGVVDDVRDSWLFGDFLGFAAALKEHSIRGTFMSCYDLKHYFNASGYDDIKFGKRWEMPGGENWMSGNDQISIYKRWDFEHGTRWWDIVDPQHIIPKIQEWIGTRSRAAKPGDIVSIILIGHGGPEGIRLGRSVLAPETLASMCKSFPADVQINLVVKSIPVLLRRSSRPQVVNPSTFIRRHNQMRKVSRVPGR